MNRRILLPLALAGLVIGAGIALETTARLSKRSGAGAAGGLGEYQGGCAGSSAPDVGNIVVEENDLLPSAGNSPALRPEGALPSEMTDQTVPNRYVVKFTPTAAADFEIDANGILQTGRQDIDAALASLGASKTAPLLGKIQKSLKPTWHFGLEESFEFHSQEDLETVWKTLGEITAVDWVEPVYKVIAFGAPNDPYFSMQWNLTGIELPEAWPNDAGENVVVAVIDTGVSTTGEDSFFNLRPGMDFVDDDEDASDEHGHGTHVAGTIAQATDNGVGVAGVAPGASILPVRVLDASGYGTSTGVANGIIWAADNGADVINLSLGANSFSQSISDACDYAESQGVVVVAATGNDGFSSGISYPAALGSTIAVGSIGLNYEIAPYSNQGQEIDLVAPGGDMSQDADGDGYADGILQETISNGTWGYWFYQGTSMATPHVAGVAALLKAKGINDPNEIRTAMLETAADQGSEGWDTTFGHGVVDPVGALGWSGVEPTPEPEPEPEPEPTPDEPDQPDPIEPEPDAPGTAPGDPDTGEPGPVEIVHVKVRHISPQRAVIWWRTNVDATTQISDGNRSAEHDHVGKVHRMFVPGKPGQVKVVNIFSEANDGTEASQEIELTFGPVRH